MPKVVHKVTKTELKSQ